MSEPSVIVFDGLCNFCDASVNFIIDHDPRGVFRFAPRQSAVGERLLREHGLLEVASRSLVLIEAQQAYTRSTAALRIARRLSGAWPLASTLLALPPRLRDKGYNLISKNRYRWFGERDACVVPTPERRGRFLDEAALKRGSFVLRAPRNEHRLRVRRVRAGHIERRVTRACGAREVRLLTAKMLARTLGFALGFALSCACAIGCNHPKSPHSVRAKGKGCHARGDDFLATIRLATEQTHVTLSEGDRQKVIPQFPITVKIPAAQTWTLTASRPGYKTLEMPLHAAPGRCDIDISIALEPEPGTEVEQ